MSPQVTRRALLQTAGVVAFGGIAGCSTSGVPKRYDIELKNQLPAGLFQATPGVTGPKPAVFHVRVENTDPEAERTYFKKTASVPTNSTRRLEDAFRVKENGPRYVISAEVEPFVEGAIPRGWDLTGSATFGWETRPDVNPIPILLVQSKGGPEKQLRPNVYIGIS
ncbi:MAG: hypothetical protein ABEJ27_01055 [Halodesulfurarchaeum sp.]